MTSPHNRYRSAPPPPVVQGGGPGPLSQLGSMAAQKALMAGINTAIPGGGFAAELATDAVPLFFKKGGPLYKQSGGDIEVLEIYEDDLGPMVDAGWDHRDLLNALDEGYVKIIGPNRPGGHGDDYFKKGGAVYKQTGGKAPLGGGQSKEGLMQARKLGALTQDEFLKAMAHAGYLQKGGKIKCGPLASVEYKQTGGEVSHHHKMAYHNPLSGGPAKGEK